MDFKKILFHAKHDTKDGHVDFKKVWFSAIHDADHENVQQVIQQVPEIVHDHINMDGHDRPVLIHALDKADRRFCVDDEEYQRRCDIVKLLWNAKAQVNTTDSTDTTPLHEATSGDMAQSLLERHANVNAYNNKGQTPLHYAALRNHLDVVHVLLAHRADANVETGSREHPATVWDCWDPIVVVLCRAQCEQLHPLLLVFLSKDTSGIVVKYIVPRLIGSLQ